MLTVECRNNHIVAIQCLQSDFGDIVSNALGYGRRDLECVVKKNTEVTAYLNLICCYSPFTRTLQTAIKTTFTGSTTNTNFRGTIRGNAFGVSVTAGTGVAMAAEVESKLRIDAFVEPEVNSGFAEILLDGADLYVWSYDPVSWVINADPAWTIEDITASPCAILDLINCLDRDQLCAILKKVYGLFGLDHTIAATNGAGALFSLPGAIGAVAPTTVGVAVYNVTALPAAVTSGTTSLFVNITSQVGNIEVFGWTPIGLAHGAHVRVRKQNTDPFSILFTDGVNNYAHVNLDTEYMDFVWDDINSILVV